MPLLAPLPHRRQRINGFIDTLLVPIKLAERLRDPPSLMGVMQWGDGLAAAAQQCEEA